MTPFRCVVADLPGHRATTSRREPPPAVPVLSTEAIMRFPQPLLADQAVLFLWRLSSTR